MALYPGDPGWLGTPAYGQVAKEQTTPEESGTEPPPSRGLLGTVRDVAIDIAKPVAELGRTVTSIGRDIQDDPRGFWTQADRVARDAVEGLESLKTERGQQLGQKRIFAGVDEPQLQVGDIPAYGLSQVAGLVPYLLTAGAGTIGKILNVGAMGAQQFGAFDSALRDYWDKADPNQLAQDPKIGPIWKKALEEAGGDPEVAKNNLYKKSFNPVAAAAATAVGMAGGVGIGHMVAGTGQRILTRGAIGALEGAPVGYTMGATTEAGRQIGEMRTGVRTEYEPGKVSRAGLESMVPMTAIMTTGHIVSGGGKRSAKGKGDVEGGAAEVTTPDRPLSSDTEAALTGPGGVGGGPPGGGGEGGGPGGGPTPEAADLARRQAEGYARAAGWTVPEGPQRGVPQPFDEYHSGWRPPAPAIDPALELAARQEAGLRDYADWQTRQQGMPPNVPFTRGPLGEMARPGQFENIVEPPPPPPGVRGPLGQPPTRPLGGGFEPPDITPGAGEGGPPGGPPPPPPGSPAPPVPPPAGAPAAAAPRGRRRATKVETERARQQQGKPGIPGQPAEGRQAMWRSADHDYPVTVHDEPPQVGPDGRRYQRVSYEGKDTFVPVDELFPAAPAAVPADQVDFAKGVQPEAPQGAPPESVPVPEGQVDFGAAPAGEAAPPAAKAPVPEGQVDFGAAPAAEAPPTKGKKAKAIKEKAAAKREKAKAPVTEAPQPSSQFREVETKTFEQALDRKVKRYVSQQERDEIASHYRRGEGESVGAAIDRAIDEWQSPKATEKPPERTEAPKVTRQVTEEPPAEAKAKPEAEKTDEELHRESLARARAEREQAEQKARAAEPYPEMPEALKRRKGPKPVEKEPTEEPAVEKPEEPPKAAEVKKVAKRREAVARIMPSGKIEVPSTAAQANVRARIGMTKLERAERMALRERGTTIAEKVKRPVEVVDDIARDPAVFNAWTGEEYHPAGISEMMFVGREDPVELTEKPKFFDEEIHRRHRWEDGMPLEWEPFKEQMNKAIKEIVKSRRQDEFRELMQDIARKAGYDEEDVKKIGSPQTTRNKPHTPDSWRMHLKRKPEYEQREKLLEDVLESKTWGGMTDKQRNTLLERAYRAGELAQSKEGEFPVAGTTGKVEAVDFAKEPGVPQNVADARLSDLAYEVHDILRNQVDNAYQAFEDWKAKNAPGVEEHYVMKMPKESRGRSSKWGSENYWYDRLAKVVVTERRLRNMLLRSESGEGVMYAIRGIIKDWADDEIGDIEMARAKRREESEKQEARYRGMEESKPTEEGGGVSMSAVERAEAELQQMGYDTTEGGPMLWTLGAKVMSETEWLRRYADEMEIENRERAARGLPPLRGEELAKGMLAERLKDRTSEPVLPEYFFKAKDSEYRAWADAAKRVEASPTHRVPEQPVGALVRHGALDENTAKRLMRNDEGASSYAFEVRRVMNDRLASILEHYAELLQPSLTKFGPEIKERVVNWQQKGSGGAATYGRRATPKEIAERQATIKDLPLREAYNVRVVAGKQRLIRRKLVTKRTSIYERSFTEDKGRVLPSLAGEARETPGQRQLDTVSNFKTDLLKAATDLRLASTMPDGSDARSQAINAVIASLEHPNDNVRFAKAPLEHQLLEWMHTRARVDGILGRIAEFAPEAKRAPVTEDPISEPRPKMTAADLKKIWPGRERAVGDDEATGHLDDEVTSQVTPEADAARWAEHRKRNEVMDWLKSDDRSGKTFPSDVPSTLGDYRSLREHTGEFDDFTKKIVDTAAGDVLSAHLPDDMYNEMMDHVGGPRNSNGWFDHKTDTVYMRRSWGDRRVEQIPHKEVDGYWKEGTGLLKGRQVWQDTVNGRDVDTHQAMLAAKENLLQADRQPEAEPPAKAAERYAQTLKEEALHAVSMGELENNPQARSTFEHMLLVAKERMPAGDQELHKYALSDVHEFFTHLQTDENFRRSLSGVPVTAAERVRWRTPQARTLLEGAVKWFGRMMKGLSDRIFGPGADSDLLTESLLASHDVLAKVAEEGRTPYKPGRRRGAASVADDIPEGTPGHDPKRFYTDAIKEKFGETKKNWAYRLRHPGRGPKSITERVGVPLSTTYDLTKYDGPEHQRLMRQVMNTMAEMNHHRDLVAQGRDPLTKRNDPEMLRGVAKMMTIPQADRVATFLNRTTMHGFDPRKARIEDSPWYNKDRLDHYQGAQDHAAEHAEYNWLSKNVKGFKEFFDRQIEWGEKTFKQDLTAVLNRITALDEITHDADGKPMKTAVDALTKSAMREALTPAEKAWVDSQPESEIKKRVAEYRAIPEFKQVHMHVPLERHGDVSIYGTYDMLPVAAGEGRVLQTKDAKTGDIKHGGMVEVNSEDAARRYIDRMRAEGPGTKLLSVTRRVFERGTDKEAWREDEEGGKLGRVPPREVDPTYDPKYETRYLLHFNHKYYDAFVNEREAADEIARLNGVKGLTMRPEPELVRHLEYERNPDLLSDRLQTLLNRYKRSDSFNALPDSAKAGAVQALSQEAARLVLNAGGRAPGLPRGYVEGASKNMLETYMQASAKSATTQAHARYGNRLTESMRNLEANTRRLSTSEGNSIRQRTQDEIARRAYTVPDTITSGIWGVLTNRMLQATYTGKLMGTSFLGINLMEPLLVGFPKLAAEYGGVAALKAMLSAYRDLGGWNILKTGWRDAVTAFKRGDNWNDYGMTIENNLRKANPHNLDAELAMFKTAAERDLFERNSMNEITMLKQPRTTFIGKTLDWLDQIFRGLNGSVEVLNRGVLALAAHRLEAAKGHGDFERMQHAAEDAIYEGAGQYAQWNSPEIFNNKWARPAAQFKKYSQRYAANYIRAVVGSFKNDKVAQARLAYMLGTLTLAAGVFGWPTEIFAAPINAMNFLGLTNFNWDDTLAAGYNLMDEVGGPEFAELTAHGVFRLIGMDVGDRIGANSLLFYGSPKSTKPEDLKTSAASIVFGAPGSQAMQILEGIQHLAKAGYESMSGSDTRAYTELKAGLRGIMPVRQIGDIYDAVRKSSGDMSTRTKGGQLMGPEYNTWQAIVRGLGFTPAVEGRRQEARRVEKRAGEQMTASRKDWLDRWAVATPAERTVIDRHIDEWNHTHPASQAIKGSDKVAAVSTRRKKEAISGLQLGMPVNKRTSEMHERLARQYMTGG